MSKEKEGSCCSSANGVSCDHIQGSEDALRVTDMAGNYNEYIVYGMDCSACAATIEKAVSQMQGISQVQVNYSSGKLKVAAIRAETFDKLPSVVEKLGYRLEKVESTRKRSIDRDSSTNKSGINIIVFSGLLLLSGVIGAYTEVSAPIISFLYGVSIIIAGYKPARSAFYALKSRSLDMNVLMTAAVIGAAAIGEWFEGAIVVWLFALGNILQARSIEKTRNSIRRLIDLAPPEAYVKHGQQLVRKPVVDIAVGEVIVVKPGDRIPLDGIVMTGESSVNQAPITGESIPVDKQAGDSVFAGTINEHGSLEISVTKLVDDTTIAKIIHLVEEAQEKKAPTEAFVDKFARIYTPIVFILAIAVMIVPPIFGFGAWGEWLYRGLELLVIACPCALVISTPVAIVSAIGNAARNGVLIKGGAFLEAAGRISAAAFDKTGTLTEGKPKVSSVVAGEGSQEQLLSVAYALEEYSTHPIAKAIVDYCKEKGISRSEASSFRNLVGKGVSAYSGGQQYFAGNLKLFLELHGEIGGLESQIHNLQQEGNTIVIVGTADRILGVIAVADRVREFSNQALEGLRQARVSQSIMLTGDNEGTAKKVAVQTGISTYYAELLPEQKVNVIEKLQAEGYHVAMVGDGINDAPALATANIGIAMGGAGTDTAMETADIVLMADNLEKLPHTIKLSRKAVRIIKQNIWFSLIVKAAALILIFPNLLTLWIAVISDTGAALIVILNSMRLLKFKS